MSVVATAPDTAAEERWLRRFASDFAESRLAVAGLAVLGLLVAAALLAPLVAPQDPYDLAQLSVLDGRLPPGSKSATGATFWLGTDDQGRDMLSAMLYGLRISLFVGATSTAIAFVIGMTLGLSAAFAHGWVDRIVMRVVDIQLSFPSILVALILLAVLGQGVAKILLALVVVQWAYYARTVRATALVEARKEYIEAARGLALGHRRIVVRHLMPNCLPPLLVIATVRVASAIALEATLSFLGLGLPVTQPSLGLLIANGFAHLLSGKFWISVYPGLALVVTIVSINLVADQLRDVLNPRLAR